MISCEPVIINFITYFGTIATFTIVYFADIPKLPFPVQGCLLEAENSPSPTAVKYLMLALWDFHFLRRTFEVLFVHIYNRRMPLIECVGAPIYYWVLALLNAQSISGTGFVITYIPLIVTGVIIFLIGEFGNAWCHLQLRFFRTKKQDKSFMSLETGHIMPHGNIFNYVSCPHYMFEIITWLGFFILTWTIPSALLLLLTVITLTVYGRKKHKAYVIEFDGELDRPLYPNTRKALIPFLF